MELIHKSSKSYPAKKNIYWVRFQEKLETSCNISNNFAVTV